MRRGLVMGEDKGEGWKGGSKNDQDMSYKCMVNIFIMYCKHIPIKRERIKINC